MSKKAISTMAAAVIIIVIVIVAAVAVYLVTRPAPPPPPPAKVGLIIATGGLGDKSFNDISYAGVKRAEEELGIDFDYVEPAAIAEYEGYQRDFAKTGDYEIIICIGFDQMDALTVVAAEYPNQNFVLVDEIVNETNVASLLFKTNESSFLIGVAAGMLTETDKVGFVGGMDITLIRDFYTGYKAGAEWANPNVTVRELVFVAVGQLDLDRRRLSRQVCHPVTLLRFFGFLADEIFGLISPRSARLAVCP